MISVILPTYNVQAYIADCLESVINQTYKDIEVIVVNDFCMDNSMTIVKEYAKKDSRIKIIHNEKNRGLGGARNAGLDAARGEFIMFLDTDDMYSPDMVEKMYAAITANESDMAVCDIMFMDNDGTRWPYKPFFDSSIENSEMFFPRQDIEPFVNMWPSAPNKIFRKSLIDEHHIRYHENILYEDHTFHYEYAFVCDKVTHVLEPLYIYRYQREDSITKDASERIFEIFTIIEYISKIFKKNLSEVLYKQFVIKITVRLLWERTLTFKRKSKHTRRFIKVSRKVLSQYRHEEVEKYRDSYTDKSSILKRKFCWLSRLKRVFLRSGNRI